MADNDEKSGKSGKGDDWEDLGEERGGLGEGIRKLFATGLSAAFLTEESIRSILSEVKLPKEVLAMLLQSAGKSKDQLVNRVATDLSTIFSKIDWVKEVSKFAETHKFKISAEIEVLKKDK